MASNYKQKQLGNHGNMDTQTDRQTYIHFYIYRLCLDQIIGSTTILSQNNIVRNFFLH